MKVIAFDPFLSPKQALDLSIRELRDPELFRRADFITLPTPMTEKTRNIINAEVDCHREEGRAHRQLHTWRADRWKTALAEAIKAGNVAGAAIDVFEVSTTRNTSCSACQA